MKENEVCSRQCIGIGWYGRRAQRHQDETRLVGWRNSASVLHRHEYKKGPTESSNKEESVTLSLDTTWIKPAPCVAKETLHYSMYETRMCRLLDNSSGSSWPKERQESMNTVLMCSTRPGLSQPMQTWQEAPWKVEVLTCRYWGSRLLGAKMKRWIVVKKRKWAWSVVWKTKHRKLAALSLYLPSVQNTSIERSWFLVSRK